MKFYSVFKIPFNLTAMLSKYFVMLFLLVGMKHFNTEIKLQFIAISFACLEMKVNTITMSFANLKIQVGF